MTPDDFVTALHVLIEHAPDVTDNPGQLHRLKQQLNVATKIVKDYRPVTPDRKRRWGIEQRVGR